MTDKITVSIEPNPTFRKEVTIPGPGGQALTLDLEFIRRDEDGLKEFSTGERAKERSNAQAVLDCVANWHNVDEPFTPAAVERLVKNWQRAAVTITTAYVNEHYWARLGN